MIFDIIGIKTLLQNIKGHWFHMSTVKEIKI